MQNNKTTLSIIMSLAIGLFVGYLLWGTTGSQTINKQGGHMMSDGTVMNSGATDMSSMMMDMNVALKGKTSDAFDQTFLSEMIVHHQGAIDMAELALINAKHEEIKDLAKAIIAAQTKEIAEMKSWQKSWYNQ